MCLLAFVRVPKVVTCSQVAGLCHTQVLHDPVPPASVGGVLQQFLWVLEKQHPPPPARTHPDLFSLSRARRVFWHRSTLLVAPISDLKPGDSLSNSQWTPGISTGLLCPCAVPPLPQKTLPANPPCPLKLHSLTLPSVQDFCTFCWSHLLVALSPVLMA